MAEFTVEINGARGVFNDIDEAKKEAMKLARMNVPDVVFIEGNEDGFPIFSFHVDDKLRLFMTTITYQTVEVDDS